MNGSGFSFQQTWEAIVVRAARVALIAPNRILFFFMMMVCYFVMVYQLVTLKGQFHGFAHVQALGLAVVNFTVSY